MAATGFDLDNAYQGYLTQRRTFVLDATVQGVDKLLDQIVTENPESIDPRTAAASDHAQKRVFANYDPSGQR
ncbi:hypothetical protein AOQ71_19515 [Bradyrhizobium manausense]|uniref:Uncharacterized protein n=1 Tax=Bradyrhizobium manausense TaxID=989370 RepID=A0A0R3DJY6_9BRAD|nr:hypothetical protein AOQ71_19515 [Bradyrhizobium manausense]